jgi:hypothetical protein
MYNAKKFLEYLDFISSSLEEMRSNLNSISGPNNKVYYDDIPDSHSEEVEDLFYIIDNFKKKINFTKKVISNTK